VIVDKSTVPVGTSELVEAALAKNLSKKLFDVASNPEFLREGVAVDDFLKPDRVVIGASSDKACKLLKQLYEPFVRQGNPIYFMDERSAEMTKYAANAYLATRITFMNEISNLCEKVGANVDNVRIGMGSDSRIGKRFLFPGIGYGGSCFPKDVQALAKTATQYSYDFKILKSVMKVNEIQKSVLTKKIKKYFKGEVAGKTIAIWGLSFKPNTDDIREAPALTIISELLALGANVRCFDPEGMKHVKEIFGNQITYCASSYETAIGADALAVLTEWSEFRSPDFEKVFSVMKSRVVFDGRNVYDLNTMKSLGAQYESMGRPKVRATKKVKV
jgi:UDPglucose 6-dehydrogenase